MPTEAALKNMQLDCRAISVSSLFSLCVALHRCPKRGQPDERASNPDAKVASVFECRVKSPPEGTR